ncbi:RNA-binding protein 34-like [Anopheles moucheti]|uniref:RNA-binding protein 34-like n=1 Tax=Anopheles moucheti TaxID=186751 RepID=UPI0022F08590|nr:RNA-binding protein 34-like [Anopheles moucheti]
MALQKDSPKMKKKSLKVGSGIASASTIIKKKKKLLKPSAIKTESALLAEPTMEAGTELKLGLKQEKTPPESTAQPVVIKTEAIGDGGNGKDTDTDGEEEKSEKVKEPKPFTIFVGNLPTTTSKSGLKALFIKYGGVKSLRFRTNDGQKILDKKNLQHVLSLNAYVQFSSRESMEKALEMNGQMVGENRIRVSLEGKKPIGDVKSTVFVGNIKRGTSENDLHNFFSKAGPIEFIRFLSAKCVAYVCFMKGVSLKKVLKLDQEKLNDRPLRIQPVSTERSNVKLNKKGNVVKRNKFPSKGPANKSNGGKANNDFHGKVSEVKNKNKTNSSKSGVGSVKQKQILAKKLKAAFNMNNK